MSAQVSPARTSEQARALRWGGYFALFVALMSSINWLVIVHHDYVMEHDWPAASGTIYSAREDSREVVPASLSTPHYQVYWTEFMVILNIPRDRCPGTMIELDGQERCTGEVKTPEVQSPTDAEQWPLRHPRDSKVLVHYDAQSDRMVLAGESVFNTYPWRKITTTGVIFLLAMVMIAVARTWSVAQSPT
jgi:hypothetical protein